MAIDHTPDLSKDVAYWANQEARLFSLPEGWEQGRELVEGITMDDASCMDRDDAIWLKDEDGLWKLRVSISDTTFVMPYRAITEYADLVGETRYMKQGNSPMIPRPISEGRLSLLENQETPVVSLNMMLDRAGKQVEEPFFSLDRIRPRRITYDQGNQILAGNGTREDIAMMHNFRTLASTLLHARRENGAFIFDDIDVLDHPIADTPYEPQSQYRETRLASQLIVQECMIAHNCTEAEYAERHNLPNPYRNHYFQDGMTLDQAHRLLGSNAVQDIEAFAQLFRRARYETVAHGHVGLGVPRYMHGSSPLRRRADGYAQANIVAHLNGEPHPYSTEFLDATLPHLNEVQKGNRNEAYAAAKRERIIFDLGRTASELVNLPHTKRRKLINALEDDEIQEIPVGMRELIREMAAEGELDAHCIKQLVFSKHNGSEGWDAVQDAITTQLAQSPRLAATVLKLGAAEGKVIDVEDPIISHDRERHWAKCTRYIIDQAYNEYVVTSSSSSRDGARVRASAFIVGRLAGIPHRRLKAALARQAPTTENDAELLAA